MNEIGGNLISVLLIEILFPDTKSSKEEKIP